MIIAFMDAANPVAIILAYCLKNGIFLVAWNIVAIRTNRKAMTETTPTITAVSYKIKKTLKQSESIFSSVHSTKSL